MSEAAVFTLQDQAFNYIGVASLNGLQVGLQAGYAYSAEVRAARNFERLKVPAIESGLRMLKRGRIDALLANRFVAWSEARRLGIESAFTASEGVVSGGPVFLAFRKTMPLSVIESFSRELAAYKQVRGVAGNTSLLPVTVEFTGVSAKRRWNESGKKGGILKPEYSV